nr:MAG TPA: Endonuclease [Caudoviricetes sp.]
MGDELNGVVVNKKSKGAMYALGRLKTGVMNKAEAAYAEYLEQQKQQGVILWYRFEGVKLRLADKTFYTPDFAVMTANGTMEMHEVKGFWQDDARVKIKVAAESYPFRFVAVKAKSKKDGGGWSFEVF